MELVLGIAVLALFSKKIIKTITDTVVLMLIFVISIVLTFIYDIPYFFSISLCVLVRYGMKDWILSIKYLLKGLIISKNRYKCGSIEKFVNVLINCNIVLFIFLSYGFIINELINPILEINSMEVILISVIIIIIGRVFRKILEKIAYNKLKVFFAEQFNFF